MTSLEAAKAIVAHERGKKISEQILRLALETLITAKEKREQDRRSNKDISER